MDRVFSDKVLGVRVKEGGKKLKIDEQLSRSVALFTRTIEFHKPSEAVYQQPKQAVSAGKTVAGEAKAAPGSATASDFKEPAR